MAKADEVQALKDEIAMLKAQLKMAKKSALLPQALQILDQLTIFCERDDKDGYEKTAATARDFLDNLPAEVQASFPDWHPKR